MTVHKDGNAVEHPPHYNDHPSEVECIEIIRHMGFNLGSAMKYIWRADLKHDSPIEDLKKALFYINDEIAKREVKCKSSNPLPESFPQFPGPICSDASSEQDEPVTSPKKG
jgi:Protein of unknwon function (DUF3310)